MDGLPLIFGLLACPLGMLLMGTVAWVSSRGLVTSRYPRMARLGARASCIGHGRRDGQQAEGRTVDAGDVSALPANAPQTFLFADLAGFTSLTEAHGDLRAAALADDFTGTVRELAPGYGAEVVKSLGDGLMIRVASARRAVELGLYIARELGARHGFPLTRVGIHTGTAVERDGDWYGSAVNVAARIGSMAAGGEVLVSESTRSAAGDIDEIKMELLRECRLRNVTEPIIVHVAERAGEQPSERLQIDPVCRMAVSADQRVALIAHEDADYSFCSLSCAEAFAGAPERYVSAIEQPIAA